MIEQGLFKNHFVGRDGFQWWIGQVAPKDTWEPNKPGKNVASNSDSEYRGYGERYKVRIMGYHTADKDELADEDLPWASVMYPVTAGGGTGGASQSSNILAGHFVFGFFLDGEDGQQPVIMGCIGYNDYQSVMDDLPPAGFVPFRGLERGETVGAALANLKGRATGGGTTIDVGESQRAAGTGGQVTGIEKTAPESFTNLKDQATIDNADEKTEVLAQPKTCEPLPVGKIQQAIRNLIRDVEAAKKGLYNFETGVLQGIANKEQYINQVIEKYATQIAGGLKQIYSEVEKFVEDKINQAMKFVYDLAFPNERNAVKQTSKTILDTVACFFRKLMGQLVQMMIKFLGDAVERVINVSKCFIDNFIGGVFGTLGGVIEGLFAGITDLVSGAVDIGEGALDLGGDVLGLIDQLLSFLNCDDRPECSKTNEWNIVSGGNQITKGDIDDIVDRAKGLFQDTKNLGFSALDNFDMVRDFNFNSVFNLEESCSVREVLCGAPLLQFFGSNGEGAAGNLIIGAAGDVIGVDMLSFGSGYNESVQAKVFDICGKGSGAILKPVFGTIPADGSGAGPGGGTPATAPASIGFGPFGPQNYPFPIDGRTSLSPVPLGAVTGDASPIYGVGPTGFGNELPPDCIDVEFVVTRDAIESNTFTFRLVDADPEFITGWDYTGDDVSGGEPNGGTAYIECVVPGKDYIVKAFLPDGEPTPQPLKIDNGGSTVRMDGAVDGGVEIVEEQVEVANVIDVDFRITTAADYANRVVIPEMRVDVGKTYNGEQINTSFRGGIQVGKVYDIQIISPESRSQDGGTRIRGGGNRFEVEEARDGDWTDVVMTSSQGRFFNFVSNSGGDSTRATAQYVLDRNADTPGSDVAAGMQFEQTPGGLRLRIGGNDLVEATLRWDWDDRSDIKGHVRGITIQTDSGQMSFSRSSGDTEGNQTRTARFRANQTYLVQFDHDCHDFGYRVTDNGQRIEYDDDIDNGFDYNGSLTARSVRQLSGPQGGNTGSSLPPTKTITQTTERPIGLVSDGSYGDLVVTAGAGKFRNVRGHTCLYRLDPPEDPEGPAEAAPPPTADIPGIDPILIPATAPTQGDTGIVDVIVIQPGGGYIPGPDGSKGGDGRTWADPGDTIVVKEDGRIETPIPPGNYFCVDAGDTVELPPNTFIITETNGGRGGGERINGGIPYKVVEPGCFTSPFPPEDEDDRDAAIAEGAYPVLLYLCDVFIESPGFGYEPNDPVIFEPDRGAEGRLRVDRQGRVVAVEITKPGQGFKELPEIFIDSVSGYNAVLLPKLCIDKDVEFEDPEKLVQVIDCVGNF